MLSTYLINSYVHTMVDKKSEDKVSTVYGYYSNGKVKYDGSEYSVPCHPTVEVSNGDRVVVTIRDNTAYVTGVLIKATTDTTTTTTTEGD